MKLSPPNVVCPVAASAAGGGILGGALLYSDRVKDVPAGNAECLFYFPPWPAASAKASRANALALSSLHNTAHLFSKALQWHMDQQHEKVCQPQLASDRSFQKKLKRQVDVNARGCFDFQVKCFPRNNDAQESKGEGFAGSPVTSK